MIKIKTPTTKTHNTKWNLQYSSDRSLVVKVPGQGSWLQIQRSRFNYQGYQIFWKLVGLEQGPLSLVSTTEELLRRKSCSSSLENQDYRSRDRRTDHVTPSNPQNLALTSMKSGGRLVSIVHS
jgi:hypothetical protein